MEQRERLFWEVVNGGGTESLVAVALGRGLEGICQRQASTERVVSSD